jgi:hypothetical protein
VEAEHKKVSPFLAMNVNRSDEQEKSFFSSGQQACLLNSFSFLFQVFNRRADRHIRSRKLSGD